MQFRQETSVQLQKLSSSVSTATHDLSSCLTAIETKVSATLDKSGFAVVEGSTYAGRNPEVGLFAYMYSFLPGRKALDVGAHIGEVSEALLKGL